MRRSTATKLLLATCALVVPCAEADLDAANVGEATAMVSTEERVVDEIRKYCGQHLPKYKAKIDFEAFSWTQKNQPELSAVQIRMDARSESDRSMFRKIQWPAVQSGLAAFKVAASSHGDDLTCGGFIEELSTGARDIDRRLPAASQFLRTFLTDHPPTQEYVDRQNSNSGCIKTMFKSGADFDAAVPSCQCITDVTFTKITSEERDEMNQWLRSGRPIASFPPMKRVKPDLAQCAAMAKAGPASAPPN